MSEQRMRILVVDDSALQRSLITQLIADQGDMVVVATAASGQEAVRRAEELQPDLVLMDIHMPDMDGIQATWLVSEKLTGGAVVMVTSEERIDFLQKAMSAGAQGYVLKPFGNGQQLLQTIRDVHRRGAHRRVGPAGPAGPAAPPPVALRMGKRIVVLGSNGGVGRTTVATGLALNLHQQTGESVLLFDADFQFGDASIHLGLNPEHSVSELVPHIDALDSRLIDSVVTKHRSGVHLLARPPRPADAEALTPDMVRAILASLPQLYSWVVVDTPLGYDDRVLTVLDSADVYVVVLLGQLGALRNARQFLDLAKRLGYSQERMCFVLNRANSIGGLRLEDITAVLGTRQILRLPSAGAAPTQAINEGRPLLSEQPRSAFAQSFSAITTHVRELTAAALPTGRSG